MASSTTKKVVIRRFDREALLGFVNPQLYLQPAGIEYLTVDGQVITVPYLQVKSVSFVRDFDDVAGPERTTFQARPKMDGLWVRARFRDGDSLEGIVPNNLVLLEFHGFTIVPPDPNSNHQRMFLPRSALLDVQVLGVVGSPLHVRKPKKAVSKEQIGLFEEEKSSEV